MTSQGQGRARRRGGRSLLRQSRYISAAAMEEVAELGHPELDVDHLLVGLLVTGGPSASCLVAAGADLPSLRGAVQRLQETDARALGVHAPAPPAVSPDRTARTSAGVPWGSRALAVMRSADHGQDDRALLRALLDDEGRRVERVLAGAGVDVEDLRASLATTTAAGDPDLPVEVTAALAALGPAHRRTSASTTHEVPVAADAVWALVGDVRRRPEWDPAVTGLSDDDGVLRLVYDSGRTTRSVRVLTERTGPRSVLWREMWHDDEHVTAVLHLAVVPAGAGSRLRVDTATSSRTLRGRVLRPLARRAAGSRARWLGQSVARAAARTDA
ncbi:Clp protease N-terminal domain-containing protein [uncultured Pseudokineococcus sp.]|uniref:Clp protease N-terminal domain-containing protein n=1 Tax=uncultured Pseudokineococcus sp. TaxID=1642928 RepID=UPI002613F792|nr:Clp protease N-terminal domain-containing protein [uncultured Pseudokineococcus sp.]